MESKQTKSSNLNTKQLSLRKNGSESQRFRFLFFLKISIDTIAMGEHFLTFKKISSRSSGGLTLTPNMWLSVTPRKWPSIILRKFYSLKNRVIDTHHSKNHEEAYQKRAITTFTRKIVGGYSRRRPPCS